MTGKSTNRLSIGGPAVVLAAIASLACSGSAGAAVANHASTPDTVTSAHASIIGGRAARPGTFPWLAYVEYRRGRTRSSCTGSVVAPNLVLTAGHCAEERGLIVRPAGLRVVTGAVDYTSPRRQVSRVSRVMIYPGYRGRGALDGWGDAALLQLSTPTTAPAVKLASRRSPPRTRAMIAGWGRTRRGLRGPGTRSLRWTPTYVQGSRWCQLEAVGSFYSRGQLCTIKPPRYETGACVGDSGGPLLARLPGGRGVQQIGITSSGEARCVTFWPTLFTSSHLIASWANSRIRELASPEASAPPDFRYYVACGLSQSAQPALECASRQRKGAFFKSNEEDVVYSVCVRYPAGRTLCAPDQEARQGTLYLNTITSNMVGLHVVTWRVGEEQVGRVQFRVFRR